MILEKAIVGAQKAANILGEAMSIFKIDRIHYDFMPYDASDDSDSRFVQKVNPSAENGESDENKSGNHA